MDKELQIRQVMWAATLHTAEQLRLTRRESFDDLMEGQLVLVATPHSINIGNVKMVYEETETSRTEKFYVEDVLLYEHKYDNPEPTWGEHPTTVSHLPEQVVIYVSY